MRLGTRGFGKMVMENKSLDGEKTEKNGWTDRRKKKEGVKMLFGLHMNFLEKGNFCPDCERALGTSRNPHS